MGIIHKHSTKLDAKITKETIHKNKDLQKWKLAIADLSPSLEKAPEIADIKQVELFTKWRKLIPDSFQDEMCPKLSKEILHKVKRDKAKKAKDKLNAKRAQMQSTTQQSNP